jgi:hypothetical protein
MEETPENDPTPAASTPIQGIRTQLAEAGAGARRSLERVRLARLIFAAVAQVAIAFIAWRLWVWRARRRRR